MAGHCQFKLPKIESNYQGFAHLINLAAQTANLSFSSLVIDMRSVTWFDANMCAPLGAILYKAGRRLNTINLANIPPQIETVLSKNSFLSNYGRARRIDTWGTTIPYNRFEPKDDRYFGSYIEKAIPEMSVGLRKKSWESIFEIFSNAVIHSETKMGIFTCGQFFPIKNRLDFAVVDLGIGIKQNIESKCGLVLPAEQAINWAMEGRNTTKTGPIPGGLGLKLLREFIGLNHGRIQVVSDRGYWEQSPNGRVVTNTFPHSFPGTVVNIKINTADKNSCILSSEIPAGGIF